MKDRKVDNSLLGTFAVLDEIKRNKHPRPCDELTMGKRWGNETVVSF